MSPTDPSASDSDATRSLDLEADPVDPRADTVSLAAADVEPPSTESEFGAGSTVGQFELQEELGRGGMGVVYRALDKNLGREVALKLLAADLSKRPIELQRFRREAAMASKLRHPRIVGVYSFGELNGRMYYTMPIVEGKSLRDVIKAGGVTKQRAAEIVEKVARAIDAAHQQRVVHRDLKPANVVLDADGEPLVLDFGLAKDLAAPDLTRTGEVLGTPSYMSPEQARGQAARADHRVDIYSLGVILYELLTSALPYPGETVNEIIHKILNSEPIPPRAVAGDVPYALETVCLKALADEPYLRYQTAGALADDLARFREGQPVQARRPGLGALALRTIRRHRGASVMTGVLVLVVLIGALMYQRGTTRLAIRQRSEQALELIKQAAEEERGRDLEAAKHSYQEAFLLAQGAYSAHPDHPKVRNPFIEVLRARAAFAERREDWALAVDMRKWCYQLTESGEDERLLRLAKKRDLAEVTVEGLTKDHALDFVPWDRQSGSLDAESTRRQRATPKSTRLELRAGSYVATHRIPGRAEADQPRYLIALERGDRSLVRVHDPGSPPAGMVYVPAAELVSGGEVVQAGPVWIDRLEVSVGDYRRFLEHVAKQGHANCGGCPGKAHTPPGFPRSGDEHRDAQPVTHVSWHDAMAYARWRGARLPTRHEWLLAAGAADGRAYPWGDQWEVGRANTQLDDLAPVARYAGDLSPYGVIGMCGNVDEWNQDTHPAPVVGDVPHRVISGTHLDDDGVPADLDSQSFARPDQRFADTGFRCAQNAPASQGVLRLGVSAPESSARPKPRDMEPLVLRVAAWPRYADPRFAEAFAARYLAETGIRVEVRQTVTVTSNDQFLPLLQSDTVDLVTPTCDLAPVIIRSGTVQAFSVPREADLLPDFRRPPFLQARGQGYGACYTSGPMWLVSLDQRHVAKSWRDLWSPKLKNKIAIWDDAVWAVTLAAKDLGLEPAFDLAEDDLLAVQAHLTALLRNGCRLWRTPEDALQLVEAQGVVVLDDWGIVSWSLRRRGRWVHKVVPEGGSARWIDAWMLSSNLEGERLDAARAWVDYAISPENQRDLLLLAGYDPTNAETVHLLDKATARARLRAVRERELDGLERWREVPRRERYLQVWHLAKQEARGQ